MTVRNRHLMVALSLLFLASDFIFAFHLTPFAGVLVAAGCALAAALVLFRPGGGADGVLGRAIDVRALGLCLLAALGLILLGGEGHLVYANADWLTRDAVLADLSRSSAIPVYQLPGGQYILRAPLGMYMIPSLAGHWLGLMAAHATLVMQNTFMLGVMIYFLCEITAKRKFLVVLLTILFSGVEIFGTILQYYKNHKTIDLTDLPSHIEGWSGIWEYSSEITQIFWVPNHALPGWWLAILILLCAGGEVTVGLVGLSIAGTAFWSPLAAVGAVPFAAALLASRWRRALASRHFWLCAGASMTFVPIAAYLVVASGTISHGLALNSSNPGGSSDFLPRLALMFVFLVFQIPQAWSLKGTLHEQRPERRLLFIVLAVVLVALPLFAFGPNNDLAMRGSIPALLILALMFSDTVVNGMARARGPRLAAMVVMALGLITPSLELARPFIFHRYAISDCSVPEAQNELAPGAIATNYMARSADMPGWLLVPAAVRPAPRPPAGSCWPDYPFDPTDSVSDHSNAVLLKSARLKSARGR